MHNMMKCKVSAIRCKHHTLILQANAEQAVQELLRDFSKSQGLKEVDTVSAEEHMDDGTPIRLAVTIDRADGSALLDFEGMLRMLSCTVGLKRLFLDWDWMFEMWLVSQLHPAYA